MPWGGILAFEIHSKGCAIPAEIPCQTSNNLLSEQLFGNLLAPVVLQLVCECEDRAL